MPLLSCPECTKDVSNRAAACPHCGLPLSPEGHGATPAAAPKPFWSPIWATVVSAAALYAGWNIFYGAYQQWNLGGGNDVVLVVIAVVFVGGPLAFWRYAHKRWG